MITVKSSLLSVSAIALVLALASGGASAQSPAPSTPDRSGTPGAQGLATGGPGLGMMRPGFMMGPGMMRGTGLWGGRFDGPCDPSVAGIAEWRIDEIERVVRPTDAQRSALADLRAASTKAAATLRRVSARNPANVGATH